VVRTMGSYFGSDRSSPWKTHMGGYDLPQKSSTIEHKSVAIRARPLTVRTWKGVGNQTMVDRKSQLIRSSRP